ncbi:hypothetical protein [Mucilaginibacter flavus]|uniref:hypothetical protein n=1 Tax=Mucilaginibacter flavus TaxID=931504 RepID=UPI0025B57DEC|nr:hypothetical protein [Mucilaginibacter flavus]MDN3582448.1 hypothetical protein [Mucilaginibacter flavus]
MKTRAVIFSIWSRFHIVFIVLTSVFFAYDKLYRFYKVKENAPVQYFYNNLFFNTPFRYYGKLTAAGSPYGYFAPNIRASGLIIGESGGKKYTALFNGFEAAMRFSVLSARVTNNLIDSRDSTDHKLEDRFMDLLFKSIAVKIYNQNKCTQDSLFVSYNIVGFPTLKEYTAGNRQPYLIKLKEVKISK